MNDAQQVTPTVPGESPPAPVPSPIGDPDVSAPSREEPPAPTPDAPPAPIIA